MDGDSFGDLARDLRQLRPLADLTRDLRQLRPASSGKRPKGLRTAHRRMGELTAKEGLKLCSVGLGLVGAGFSLVSLGF